MLFVVFVFLGALLYFLPTFIAYNKKSLTVIALVNFFLGWTIVGWVFTLIWAIVDKTPRHPTPPVLDAPEVLDGPIDID